VVARVYLVPGFFGFANLGEMRYFEHVKEALERSFARFGEDVQVHRVDTLPTGSISRRSQRLLEVLQQTAGDDGPIHLVGHSTGALDARMLLDPERDQDALLLARVKTVVSVAGAHRGTPLASAFRTAFGKQLLQLLALMTIRTLKMGPLPVTAVRAVAAVLGAVDSAVGAKPDFIDELTEQLLSDFTADRRIALHQLFEDVFRDQALLDELTPELAQHFDVQTHDRQGVRYACVVTEARRPSVRSTVETGFSPYAQASHAVYHALYHLTGRSKDDVETPTEALFASEAIVAALGDMPEPRDNDGIVPTLSQFHGRVLRVVKADHHDVIGHFDDQSTTPPHIDWLLTGTGFTRAQFDALWTDVAAFVLESQRN
jgi:triacylglycerol esterase/lipase EstA (alpha/beta hydrolase family)